MRTASASRTLARAAAIAVIWLRLLPANAQDSSGAASRLDLVTGAVLSATCYGFVDRQGDTVASPMDAPPRSTLKLASPYTDWRYWNGVLSIAMIRAAESAGGPELSRWAQRNIEFGLDHSPHFETLYDGSSQWEYPFAQLFTMDELDDCGAMGAGVIEVHRRNPQPRLEAYIRKAADFILVKQSRLEDGTFVRPFPPPLTLWADDLYMSVSFLSRMGEWSGDTAYLDEGARQVVLFHGRLFDRAAGLMSHCWYAGTERRGIAYWGRANGWAVLAQVDLLDRLPERHPMRDTLLHLLRTHLAGLVRYQSSGGLWHQLLDRSDSYLETSCSAMFTYALAGAVNRGYVDPGYIPHARAGWKGVMSRIRIDGQVEGVCAGTGIGEDLAYYYTRPTPLNDIHGIGAVILAAVEMMELERR